MAVPRKLYSALRYTEAEAKALANTLGLSMERSYRATLHNEAAKYDRPAVVRLDPSVRESLRREAIAHARSIVATYNRALATWLEQERASGRELEEILARYEEWALHRAETWDPVIAVTETYVAHADAVVGFYRGMGLAPQFDFGGHGDEDPACPICQAIYTANPHELSQVVELGVPHPNCRQTWHALPLDDAQLPERMHAGLASGGILGGVTLSQRAGGATRAAQLVEALP